MSDSDTPAVADESGGISGDAGLARLGDAVKDEQREQRERLTEAEKQKQRIMRERGAAPDGEPINVELDGYEFAFSPLPKKVRVWMENSSFEFLGFSEEELESHPEKGKQFRDVRDRTVEILAENSRAAAYDADFWRDWVGLEERMALINDVIEAHDERAGN